MDPLQYEYYLDDVANSAHDRLREIAIKEYYTEEEIEQLREIVNILQRKVRG